MAEEKKEDSLGDVLAYIMIGLAALVIVSFIVAAVAGRF